MDSPTSGVQIEVVELFDIRKNANEPLLPNTEGKIQHPDGSVEEFVLDQGLEGPGVYWAAYEYDTTLAGDPVIRIKQMMEK